MDLLVTFLAFLSSMIVSLILEISMVIPLLVGFVLFVYLSIKRGFKINVLTGMIKESFNDSFIVIGILLLIGCLTGLWRVSGTIAYFVDLGISAIPSSLFILASFILTALMSFALGTSFGVTATAGVILMSIAKAGGVNQLLTAGAIMSGVYIGDRGSPAASSGNLVAVLTHTNMTENVKIMAKDSFLGVIICFLVYGVLSFVSPMQIVDTSVLNLLRENFKMEWLCLLPAIIMVVLPLMRVTIKRSMIISIVVSILVAMLVQNLSFTQVLGSMLFGYSSDNIELHNMLSGGGLASMIEVCLILLISGTYGGIFKGTGMLKSLDEIICDFGKKHGRFYTNVLMAIGICGIFCNQTIGIMMQNQLNNGLYKTDENKQKMIDIEDSVVLIAGLVPWCIACSVPLKMLGVNALAVPFAMYLWIVPVIRIIKEKAIIK